MDKSTQDASDIGCIGYFTVDHRWRAAAKRPDILIGFCIRDASPRSYLSAEVPRLDKVHNASHRPLDFYRKPPTKQAELSMEQCIFVG